MSKKIIAIVGMCGVGKSVASDLLEKMDYQKVYFGGVTMDKLKELHMEITPQNEKNVREELRRQYGMGAYALLLLPKIQKLSEENNVVLDGLYSWDELKILKEKLGDNLFVVAVIADKDIRYQRLSTREIRPLNNIEAKERDINEIENIAKAGPIAYADYYIYNNGTLEEYKDRLLEIIKMIDQKKESDKK